MIFDIRSNKDSGLGIKNHIPREARRRLVRTQLPQHSLPHSLHKLEDRLGHSQKEGRPLAR